MGNNAVIALGDQVVIKVSGETGQVIGRAQYMTSEPSNLVRYKSADGRAVEAWWPDSAVEKKAE